MYRLHDKSQNPCSNSLILFALFLEHPVCMHEAFSSNFDRLTELFSRIMDLCESSNPLRVWERAENLMITDFRRRHARMVLNNGISKDFVLNEIQNSLAEISPALSLKSLNLSILSECSYHIE